MLFVSIREAKRMVRTVAVLLKEAVRDSFFYDDLFLPADSSRGSGASSHWRHMYST
eukprot:UN17592